MSANATFVFALIGVAAALMASNRIRYDIVALMVVLALILGGVLTAGEALAGFGSPVIILVAGLLIVGEMLARTGVARAVGNWILKRGGREETKLLTLIMAGAALMGSVMSSTAVVAIFIPIVLRIAAKTKIGASRMLLPMSYAALISGMLTLIATTPNIVVHEELVESGYTGFGFFSFAPIGLAVLVVAIAYFLVIGRRLLKAEVSLEDAVKPTRSIIEMWDDYRVDREYVNLELTSDSPLNGMSIADSDIEARYRITLLGILRRGGRNEDHVVTPDPQISLATGDILLMLGSSQDIQHLQAENRMHSRPGTESYRQRWLWELGCATIMIHPDSQLLGKTLSDAEFRSRLNLRVVGLRRGGQPVANFADIKLAVADSLLVAGAWDNVRQLESQTHDFVVMETPAEQADTVPAQRRMPIALSILAGMILLTLFDIVPLVAAVLMAALAAVFTRCLTMEDAYRAIPLSSIVLIAGMLPLADALNVTGGTRLIVDALMDAVGEGSPYLMLSVIFWLTAVLGLVLSNTASAVLVAPIAVYAANALGVSPYAFGVAVLIAASAAYSTPVSTPVVTLVVEPGRYKFADFLKLGLPLLFLTYVTTLILAPIVFPFMTT